MTDLSFLTDSDIEELKEIDRHLIDEETKNRTNPHKYYQGKPVTVFSTPFIDKDLMESFKASMWEAAQIEHKYLQMKMVNPEVNIVYQPRYSESKKLLSRWSIKSFLSRWWRILTLRR